MSDLSKLLEMICPRCNGELKQGIFVFNGSREVWTDALRCKPCKLVWENPKKGAA